MEYLNINSVFQLRLIINSVLVKPQPNTRKQMELFTFYENQNEIKPLVPAGVCRKMVTIMVGIERSGGRKVYVTRAFVLIGKRMRQMHNI